MNGLETLGGLTLLIGRSPGTDQLLVSVSIGGKSLAANVPGISGVPHTVSRCKVAEDNAHAKLTFGADGMLTLTNANVENVTYVGSTAISTKRVSETDTIALGRDRFTVPLQKILATAISIVAKATPQGPKPQPGKQPPQPISISHLEQVWNDYQAKQDEFNRRQQRMVRMRMFPMGIGLLSGIVAGIAVTCGWTEIKYVTIVLAVLSFAIFLYNMLQKDTIYDDRKAADDQLMDDYVCPNPQCGRYLNKQPYRVIRQNQGCPYCRVPWTET